MILKTTHKEKMLNFLMMHLFKLLYNLCWQKYHLLKFILSMNYQIKLNIYDYIC